jgi:hypothetical protein
MFSLVALEILSLITAEQSHRQTIAAHPALMDSVEKLRIGSLSQKKLADEVHERLHEAYLLDQVRFFVVLHDSLTSRRWISRITIIITRRSVKRRHRTLAKPK